MGYVGRGLNQEGGQYRKLDDISSGFNGSETSFNLTVSNLAVTPTAQNLLISINGVIQEPGSAFSMNGSTITFTEAPAATASFFGVVMGEASYIAYDTVGANELGVTAGTVKASRGVVVDSSKDVTGFNQITSTTFSGIFSGALSSSAQIATDISGSITESSASFSTRVTNTESSASQLNQDLKTSASPTFTGGTYTSDLGVSGSMTVKGTLTAQEFKTEFVSASITFTSGSHKLGDSADDIQQMTGSLRITGSGDHYFQTGKVGIGVTNPSSFYESHLVVGDGTGEEAISIYGGSTSTGYLLFADSSSGSGRYAGQVRYNFNTNDLIFATNNVSTARMTIDSSGNVAIGSHSPSSLLDVRGNSSIVGFGTDSSADFGETYFASGVAINFGYGTNANTGGIINYRGYQNDSSQFRDLTIMDGKGNTVAFFDGSANAVGIGGVTSPSSPLTVKTDSYSSNIAEFLNPSDTTLVGAYCTGNPGSGQFYVNAAAGTTKVLLNSIGDSYFTGGDVGIGTTTPDYLLDVESTGTTFMRLLSTNTNGVAGLYMENDTVKWYIDTHGGVSDSFLIGEENVLGGTALSITTGNNVGIGTQTPLAKLHVQHTTDDTDENGNIAMTVGGGASGDVRHYWGVNNSSNYAYYGAVEHATQYVPLVLQPNGSNVGIGTTGPAVKLDVDSGASSDIVKFQNNSSTSGLVIGYSTNLCSFDLAASQALRIRQASGVPFLLNTNGVMDGDFNDTSDIALKKNINDLSDTLQGVKNLKPSTFKWIDELKGDRTKIGFIAQDVEEQFPELVDGEDGRKSINTIGLVSVLTKTVQELIKRIEELES